MPDGKDITLQKWMLENDEFMDRLGQHAARRIRDSVLEHGEVDWDEIISGLSQDMRREMNWFSPRNRA
jgi:hypothetical protein